MELLNITLPVFARTQFANIESQNVWGNKIEKVKGLYDELEMLTVQHGIRDCAIGHDVSPHEMEFYMREYSKKGLYVVPIKKENPVNGSDFAHITHGYSGEGEYGYRVAISKSWSKAQELVEAEMNSDDVAIGKLLGFPTCCSSFFGEQWKNKIFDPIWQQAINTPKESIKNFKETEEMKFIRLRDDVYHTTLSVMRYLDVRFLSHFPCSFKCDHSRDIANDWIQVAVDSGFKEEVDMVTDIMNLPFEWSCYKGVAIVNTPVFKIAASSMACYPKHVIQVESDYYPKEAPTGIQFPWRFNVGCGN